MAAPGAKGDARVGRRGRGPCTGPPSTAVNGCEDIGQPGWPGALALDSGFRG